MNVAAQKITPFLWFDDNAEEAARFYTSIFDNSRIDLITRYGEVGPGKAGTVMTVKFELDGVAFVALNGGPIYTFTPGISFVVNCDTQAEIDKFWITLSEGGEIVQCGWLVDKFGVSWQVVPTALPSMLSGDDEARSQRVMAAMLEMKKLDLPRLQAAYDGA